MSTLNVTTIKSQSTTAPPVIQNSAGTAIGQFCRAWVNFNGTGTVTIRDSFNVGSITDTGGSGNYTINFSNSMPNINYNAIGSVSANGSVGLLVFTPNSTGAVTVTAPTVTACAIHVGNPSIGELDATYVMATFFSN